MNRMISSTTMTYGASRRSIRVIGPASFVAGPVPAVLSGDSRDVTFIPPPRE